LLAEQNRKEMTKETKKKERKTKRKKNQTSNQTPKEEEMRETTAHDLFEEKMGGFSKLSIQDRHQQICC
jgi:hypothetical protein